MKDKSYFVMIRKAPYKDRFVGSISMKNGEVTWMGSKGTTIFESILNPDGTLGKNIRRGKIEMI